MDKDLNRGRIRKNDVEDACRLIMQAIFDAVIYAFCGLSERRQPRDICFFGAIVEVTEVLEGGVHLVGGRNRDGFFILVRHEGVNTHRSMGAGSAQQQCRAAGNKRFLHVRPPK